jgi:hypothetical protein
MTRFSLINYFKESMRLLPQRKEREACKLKIQFLSGEISREEFEKNMLKLFKDELFKADAHLNDVRLPR